MITIYKTTEQGMIEIPEIEKGVWIQLINPTAQEIADISVQCEIDPDYIRAALDEEERARIESDNGQTLILVDVPTVEAEGKSFVYNTYPLGVVITEEILLTVCLKDSPIFNDFTDNRIKNFSTQKKTRFLLQLLYSNSSRFLQYLKQVDKASTRVHNILQKSMKNKELFQLLALLKSLVYFSTSLASNEMVLEKLMKMDYVKKYPDDIDMLGDVIVENKQAIEMCNIYRDILGGTMDAYGSIISNNLNIVMKFLAAVTIVISVPTLIASMWGMNVDVPFHDNPNGFYFVFGLIALVGIIVTILMRIKKMF